MVRGKRRRASRRDQGDASWGPGTATSYRWQLPLERAASRAAVELADPGPRDVLLDVATGTGALLAQLAPRASRPDRAIGIDSSRPMLDHATSLPTGWTLEMANAESLPFPNRSFDVVTIAYLIHFLEPRARAQVLAEAARVLRPEGRLVTVTPISPHGWLGRWQHHRPRTTKWPARCDHSTPLPTSNKPGCNPAAHATSDGDIHLCAYSPHQPAHSAGPPARCQAGAAQGLVDAGGP